MKNLFCLLLCCAALPVTAQQTNSLYHFKTAITTNPTVLLANDNTLMAGAEHRLKSRLALVLDAGYIFTTYHITDNRLKGASGFAVRPALKLYDKKNRRGFIMLQAAYKQVNYKLNDWLGKACVNGVPAYQQLEVFRMRRNVLSFNFITGGLFRISDQVLLEVYSGVGVKTRHRGLVEKNVCYDDNLREFDPFFFADKAWVPNIPMGVKLLLPLR